MITMPNDAYLATKPLVSAYHEMTAQLGKGSNLNNVMKVPVVLAAEMIQMYHRSEIPFMDKVLKKGQDFIPVLKDGKELQAAVDDLKVRGITELPFVMPHSDATFAENQIPAEYKEYFKDFIPQDIILGYIRDITWDDKNHRIKGVLYLTIADQDAAFLHLIELGKIINVSIGFVCDWDGSGEFNGEAYSLRQTKIKLGHLAGLLHGQGKCPAGICGINQDAVKQLSFTDQEILAHLIQIRGEYYDLAQPKSAIITDICPCQAETKSVKNAIDSPLPTNVPTVTPVISIYAAHALSPNYNRSSTMPTIEELIKLLDEANAKIKSLTDSQTSAEVTSLKSQLHDNEMKVTALQAVIATRDKEITECNEKAKKAKDEAIEDYTLTQKFKAAGITEINGKKIEDTCLHDKRTVIGFYDQYLIKNGVPKPGQDAHDTKVTINTPKDTVTSTVVTADMMNKLGKEGAK